LDSMVCSVGTFYDPLVSSTIPPSEWWCVTGIFGSLSKLYFVFTF
jgi:D-arabinose 1-dehydrogenase-like Zn-dependent alcohol dehydrogenase